MNSFTFVAVISCLAIANAGVIVAPTSSKIIQGPSSRTTVVGPDGSSISSENPGGSIIQEQTHGVVAETGSVVAVSPAVAYAAAPALSYAASPVAYSTHGAPLAYSTFPLAYSGHLTSYSAPAAYSSPIFQSYSAPLAYSHGVVAEKQLDTVVSGPSGTISTSKTVHRPAYVAEPQVYAAGVHAYYI